MEILAILAGVFLLFKSGALSSLASAGLSVPQPNVAPPALMVAPSISTSTQAYKQDAQFANAGIGEATSVASSASKALGAASGLTKAIPIVGAALAAIADMLLAASAKRAAQARDENSAEAAAIPGFDQGVTVVVTAYNNGQITAAQASSLFDQMISMYWSEVSPHIQPGRNGCASGARCPGAANPNSSTNLATTAPSSYCSGSIGASCCVGCASLAVSVANMKYAVSQVNKSGGSMPASIQAVYPSKYGGISRPLYTVTFTRPSTAFTL